MEKITAEMPLAYMAFPGISEDAQNILNQSLGIGALNQQLREHLSPASETSKKPLSNNIIETAVDVVTEILKASHPDRTLLTGKLAQLFKQQTTLYYQAAIPSALRKRQYISRHGLIISADNCITSILDILRVRAFIRGVDSAIHHMHASRRRSKNPVHIVYPACGPFAPLLLPLLSYYHQQGWYSPLDVQVTLIDIQQAAIISLHTLVEALDVGDYIREIQHKDAMAFHKQSPIDIVLLEAMQHGFSREGHLPLAKYFASLLEPEGIFIPQEVSVSAVLNIGQREFVNQWGSTTHCEYALMNPGIKDERTDLGEILSVTQHSLSRLKVETLDENTSLVECNSVRIPENLQQVNQQLLLICSRVRTFNNEWVNEYDSGITHPLPDGHVCIGFTPNDKRPGDLLINPGDILKFYYRLNGLPGFFAACDQG